MPSTIKPAGHRIVPTPPSAGPPRRASLVEQTVGLMRQLIAGGQWVGELPGEEALRRRFGISRVTMRKALVQLAGQNVIRSGGRGRKNVVNRDSGAAAIGRPVVGVVKCLSPFPEIELVLGTRIIFDEIRKDLPATAHRLEWEVKPALWRGDPAKGLRRLTAEPGTACWLLYRASPEIQQWFLDNRIPCLVLGPCHEGILLPGVEVDVAALGRHAASMAGRLGHRHLACLVFNGRVASSVRTLEGLRTLVLPDGQRGRVTVMSDDGTTSGLRAVLTGVMAEKDPPTLLMVTESVQAWPVLGILRELGRRVPQDVSVLVRDHEPFLDRSVPELSRYSSDWGRYGRLAARLISDVVASGSGKQTRRKLLPTFIPGETLARRRPD